MKHNKIVDEYYKINLETSNRMMPQKLEEFFEGFDLGSLGDDWHDFHETIRDYEGDFEGIRIFYGESMSPLYDFIENKIGSKIGEIRIEITCI